MNSRISSIAVHFALWGACIIALFPILRVTSISLSNTDTMTSVSSEPFPPRGEASISDYLNFFTGAITPQSIEPSEPKSIGVEQTEPTVFSSFFYKF